MIYAAMDNIDKHAFCQLLDYHRTNRFRGIKKVRDDGTVDAMVGYDDWTANSVRMHVWLRGKNALSRKFIQECFRYPFMTAGVGIAIAVVICNNEPVLELIRKLGFTHLHTIKDGYALGTDLAIQELRRENCRWLGSSTVGRQS